MTLSDSQRIISNYSFSKIVIITYFIFTIITLPAATYDIQSPSATSAKNGVIHATGMLINNSRAYGCFLAIQCNITTKITFVALKRNGTSQYLSELIEIPSSNYTVYAHDLEEGAVINTHPANLDPDNVGRVTVNGGTSKYCR